MSMPFRFGATTAAACLVVAPSVWGQQTKGDQDIRHRRAAFTLMSSYFERLVQTAEGGRPYDPKAALKDAQTVEALSKLPWAGFVPGSESGNTRASPDIWLEEERFRSLALDMQDQVQKLRAVAETEDLNQLKAAVGIARKSCGACHDVFRLK